MVGNLGHVIDESVYGGWECIVMCEPTKKLMLNQLSTINDVEYLLKSVEDHLVLAPLLPTSCWWRLMYRSSSFVCCIHITYTHINITN